MNTAMESIRDSEAWRSTLGKEGDNHELNDLMTVMPPDLAMLTYVSQHPELRDAIERERFPETEVTHSTFLEPASINMNYDQRLQALQDAKFSFLNDTKAGRDNSIYQTLKSDPACRGAFAKVIMNNSLFGCLLNNLRLDGDLDYCFFSYFSRYPDDFKSLLHAFATTKKPLRASQPPFSGQKATPTQGQSTPLQSTQQVNLATNHSLTPIERHRDELSPRISQVCMMFDSFPSKNSLDELAQAKAHIESLKKEAAIKSLSIESLQKDLLHNQHELSTIRRACGYQYQPSSQWSQSDSRECGLAPQNPPDALVVPYQSLTFSEVPATR